MALVIWRVQDDDGAPIGGALIEGDGDTLGHWQGLTNACGDFVSELGPDKYAISITHPAFVPRLFAADIADCGVITTALEALPVVIPTIRPVHPSGPGWLDDRGEAWRWQFVTAFKAAQRWVNGEDLSGFVNWTRQVGANGWRVFLQHAYLDSFAPDWPPRPWQMPIAKVRPFVDWCYAQGLYLELTILCDCQVFEQDVAQQTERVRQVLDVLKPE